MDSDNSDTVPLAAASTPLYPNHVTDEWKSWPAPGRHFKPGWQDQSKIRGLLDAAETRHADRPSSQKVLHISEFASDGSYVLDQYLTEDELADYFANSNQSSRWSECQFRLFFASSDRAWDAVTRSYMRRWWYHYSVPIDVAFAFSTQPTMAFKIIEDNNVVHLWMRCHLNFEPLKEDGIEYYTDPARHRHTLDSSTLLTAFYEPSIYIRYIGESRQSTVLILDYSPLYAALRRTCEHAQDTKITRNPFVFLVSYLDCLISSIQTACAGWMTTLNACESAIFEENSNYSIQLKSLSRTRRGHQHTSQALDVVRQNIKQIRDEHHNFAQNYALPRAVLQLVNDRLQDQEADIQALAREVRSYENAVAGHIEIIPVKLLGLSQLQNAIRMRTMAEDNQKQAVATQAIARDTKRDSEVMKTITVVTLIYLPATFVCTLLSMGIFEWPSGDESGGLKLARTWWIFLAIAIPLSFITCSLAFAWLWFSGRGVKVYIDSENQLVEVAKQRKLSPLAYPLAKFRAARAFVQKHRGGKSD